MSVPNLTDLRRIDELTQMLTKLESEIESAKQNLADLNDAKEQKIAVTRDTIYANKLNQANLQSFQAWVSKVQEKEAEIKTQKDTLVSSSLATFFKSQDFVEFVNRLTATVSRDGQKVQIIASSDMADLIGCQADTSLKSGTLRLKTDDIVYILDPVVILEPMLDEILTRQILGSEM